ncbi:MAG: riboflavin biosynthesis protein RibF [Fibrobacterota bacterium]|nr:riboflavin biosynthesis protein RibF [Fibrobacterota bacterium]QQS03658.1 MAG: riboflavin biosynthesis protein RibF [Fibrobacterota bacterium]
MPIHQRTMPPVDIDQLHKHAPPGGCVVTVGNFDGVHRGHQRLLDAARSRARALDVPLVGISFEPHTRHFLDPRGGPELLSTWVERQILMREHGVDLPLTLRFEDDVRRLSAEAFLDLLVDDLGAVELVLGFDHRFGRGGAGTAEAITPHCQQRGLALSVVGALEREGLPVSSTSIRKAMLEWGGFESAVDALGHPWSLWGEVVRGDGRGRTIGFPTANLEPINPRKLLPASGVYAGHLIWNDQKHPAVANIGTAPTFQRGIRVVEVHSLDGIGPEYGQICRLDLYFQLRQECRFESLDALRAQIGHDAETARIKVATLQ